MLQMPFCQHPTPTLWTGGQPSLSDLPSLRELGIRTVIDLRALDEPRPFDAQTLWTEQGFSYVHLPIRGVPDLNPENARTLQEAVTSAEGGVLVHCASANRVGALFACGARWLDHQDVEEALVFGRERGLKQMEPMVRGLLTSRA